MSKKNIKKYNNRKRGKLSDPPFYIGKLKKNSKSYGFVDPITEEEYLELKPKLPKSVRMLNESIYIAGSDIMTANDNDIVLVEILRTRGGANREGKIRYIVKRQKSEILGTITLNNGFAFVVPDDETFISDIYIPKDEIFGAKTGDKVLVKITKYVKSKNENCEGKVVKIVARKGDIYTHLKSILAENGIEEEFPDHVLSAAKNMPEEVSKAEKEGRVDLSNIQTYTIDGEDAKDLDDAVAIEKSKNYKVWISIADVSHYVTEKSDLDIEAMKRGNSIYLIDTVIPMLPFELSNNICSLNEGKERLALTVEVEISNDGKVVSSNIYKSVVVVDKRMSYNEVQDILDGNYDKNEYDEKIVNDFKLFERLTKILIKRRKKEGYISFNIPEQEVILDDNAKVVDVTEREDLFSNMIIEQLMLLANEEVAKKCYNNLAVIYRVHETPDPERVEEINEGLAGFGLKLNMFPKTEEMIKREKKNSNKSARTKYDNYYVPQSEYNRVIAEIEEKKRKQDELVAKGDNVLRQGEYLDYDYASYLLLRSMRQARYSENNLGHFGIGSKYYLHFTAPIRRYSDIFVHREISRFLAGKNNVRGIEGSTYDDTKKKAKNVAEHVSSTERIAQDMEREYTEIMVSEYMENYIGKEFNAVVTSIKDFGMFVSIGNGIEGLIRKENVEQDNNMLLDDFKIGQVLDVVVTNVDVKEGNIDFELLV